MGQVRVADHHHDLFERVRALVLRRRDEEELDQELRFHLEMEAEQRRRLGASPAEARPLVALQAE